MHTMSSKNKELNLSLHHLKPHATTPIAALYQMLAAVVKLETVLLDSDFIIIPAPKKPIPETICAAILVASPSPDMLFDTKVKSNAAVLTVVCVLIPAGLCLSSLSFQSRVHKVGIKINLQ